MPRKTNPPCNVNTSDLHYKAMLWCHRNKIYIKPRGTKKGEVQLEIHNSYKNNKNRITFSPETYTQCESQQKIWDLYVKLFEKYKKETTL